MGWGYGVWGGLCPPFPPPFAPNGPGIVNGETPLDKVGPTIMMAALCGIWSGGGGGGGNVHFLEGFFGGGLWGFGQSVGRGSKRAAGSDFRAVLGQKKGILGSDPKGYGAEWGGAVSPLWLPVVLG